MRSGGRSGGVKGGGRWRTLCLHPVFMCVAAAPMLRNDTWHPAWQHITLLWAASPWPTTTKESLTRSPHASADCASSLSRGDSKTPWMVARSVAFAMFAAFLPALGILPEWTRTERPRSSAGRWSRDALFLVTHVDEMHSSFLEICKVAPEGKNRGSPR